MKFSYMTVCAVSASLASAYTTSDIPSCAIPCFESGAPQVGCTVTDQTCQCAKASELTDRITGCVTDACSIEDALKTQQVSTGICEQLSSSASTAAATSTATGSSSGSSVPSSGSSNSTATITAPTSSNGTITTTSVSSTTLSSAAATTASSSATNTESADGTSSSSNSAPETASATAASSTANVGSVAGVGGSVGWIVAIGMGFLITAV